MKYKFYWAKYTKLGVKYIMLILQHCPISVHLLTCCSVLQKDVPISCVKKIPEIQDLHFAMFCHLHHYMM
jgi:hypothetical protein